MLCVCDGHVSKLSILLKLFFLTVDNVMAHLIIQLLKCSVLINRSLKMIGYGEEFDRRASYAKNMSYIHTISTVVQYT